MPSSCRVAAAPGSSSLICRSVASVSERRSGGDEALLAAAAAARRRAMASADGGTASGQLRRARAGGVVRAAVLRASQSCSAGRWTTGRSRSPGIPAAWADLGACSRPSAGSHQRRRVRIAPATLMIAVFSPFILSGHRVIGEIGISRADRPVDAFLRRTMLVPGVARRQLSGGGHATGGSPAAVRDPPHLRVASVAVKRFRQPGIRTGRRRPRARSAACSSRWASSSLAGCRTRSAPPRSAGTPLQRHDDGRRQPPHGPSRTSASSWAWTR